MDRRVASRLVMHGTVVIVLGLLIGFVYANVVTGQQTGEERAYRMAHLEGILNGLVMIVVGASADRLVLGRIGQRLAYWGLLATGYGNVVAASLGALTGQRGLAPTGPAANWAVFLLFMVAVVGVLVGLGAVIHGAWAASRTDHPIRSSHR